MTTPVIGIDKNVTHFALRKSAFKRHLGRGGMGAVYEVRMAELPENAEHYALKLCKAWASPKADQRFREEAATLSRLRLARIVELKEFDLHNRRPYYTMPLMNGSLRGALNEFVPWPTLASRTRWARQCRIAQELAAIAQAVQHAHGRGFFHLDLKPENLLLDEEQYLHVSDWDLARKWRGDTDTGLRRTSRGSEDYMAPDLLANKTAPTEAADVYSLGAILYEMFTGDRPKHEQPLELPDHVNHELRAICRMAMAGESARYARPAVLAEDLLRSLNGEPILTRPVGPMERARRWCWRNRIKFAMIALVLMLVGVALFYASRWYQQRAHTEQLTVGALEDGKSYLIKRDFLGAEKAVDQAKDVLRTGGSAELSRRAADLRRDLLTALELEEIFFQQVMILVAKPRFSSEGDDYARALKDYLKLDVETGDAGQVVRGIIDSAIRRSLIIAIDDWAGREEAEMRTRLVAIADKADNDRSDAERAWRERLRNAVNTGSVGKLKKLAEEKDRIQEPTTRVLLARALLKHRNQTLAVAVLESVQKEHPEDPFAGFDLASLLALDPSQADDTVGYLRAVRALRPKSPTVLQNLARAVSYQGKQKEAMELCDVALQQRDEALQRKEGALKLSNEPQKVDRQKAVTWNIRAWASYELGKSEEADKGFVKALGFDPRFRQAHNNWALLNFVLRKYVEAETSARVAI